MIFPNDKELSNNSLISIEEKALFGTGGKLRTFGITIPQQSQSYLEFYEKVKQTENELLSCVF